MNVFHVTTTIPQRFGMVQVTIAAPYDTIYEFQDDLIDDKLVYVARLHFDKGENGEQTVRGASPYSLGVNAVASIAPPHFPIDKGALAEVLYDFDWGDDDGDDD